MLFLVAEFAKDGVTVGYASCWIADDSCASAQLRAQCLIESQGYLVVAFPECYEVSADAYADDQMGLEYYEQALLDDEVCVLYTEGEEDEEG